MDQDALENVFSLGKNSYRRMLHNTKFEQQQFKKYAERININIRPDTHPINMSGGEQQKLLLMRWIMSTAKIFIFDEPTQNIDIPSKIDIYNLFNDLIMKNASIIVCSSNLEELAGTCDRVLLLDGGVIAKEFTYQELDKLSDIYAIKES